MNKKIKNVTIYDVAREAGVSTSTVSRTLRDEGYPVSSKTREKVYEAVKKLNYDIEIYEKKQEDRSEKRIAVVVPNIINPYYSTLITGVEYNLHVSGMEMVLYSTGGSKDKEVSVVEDIVESKPLGVIIISICENHDHIQKLIDANI